MTTQATITLVFDIDEAEEETGERPTGETFREWGDELQGWHWKVLAEKRTPVS